MTSSARVDTQRRMAPILVATTSFALPTSHPSEEQRVRLGALMLDAYHDTFDDVGESLDDALSAIDYYFGSIVRPHSYVMLDASDVVAFAFVFIVNDVRYIDHVVVASARKRLGVGGALVRRCLRLLVGAGISEVGATITDGNIASERLFTGLSIARDGSWT